MANTELLNVNVLDKVVVLTLNRPKALNALNKQLITDLHGFFTQALESYNCSGVILTGSGAKAFAAGADIKEFVNMTPEEMQTLSALVRTDVRYGKQSCSNSSCYRRLCLGRWL